ncbi:putative oxidoreductase YjdA [Streptomyces daqingensis]|uniref:Oxidoreductase YjdA n=1 Tax=Streptomyces daqingensis TaxID=1472640 RepID=A0ABQ2MKX2_9ACTN|nr:SDR family oxidoreductase [Streptomyces daqingensis]GGO54260.1 putative oxidoreductase YjdA [Streptomyces daqingensis]
MTFTSRQPGTQPGPPAENAPYRDALPLRGRTALVTGASRRTGIGFAVARRLAAYGASVYLHHHRPHDDAQPWGSDPDGPEALVRSVQETATAGALVAHGPADLTEPGAPARLVEEATGALAAPRLDALVCNHALSGSDGPLESVDAAMLDAHWAVNTRSVILLVQAFAAQHRGEDAPTGRVVTMTSGQDVRGGMPGELCYALAKGALASSVRTLATALAPRITVNAVNPGPVDTGYRTGADYDRVAALFPGGQWATPDVPARLVSWLTTDEASWITGEVVNSENGFGR